MKPPYYREHPPSAALSGIIHCYWEYGQEEGGGQDRSQAFSSLPLGLPEHITLLEGWCEIPRDGGAARLDGSVVAGIQLTSKSMALSGSLRMFGVAFRPFALARFVAGPIRELTDRIVPVDEASPFLRSVSDGILAASSAEERVAAADARFLGALEGGDGPAPGLVLRANASIVRARGQVKVTRLASDLGVSLSCLRRNFDRYIGISPKRYADLIRSADIIGRAASAAGAGALAGLSSFFDQAHFAKDFRKRLRAAPGAFLSAPKTPLERTILEDARFLQYEEE